MTKDEAIATLEAIKQFGMGKWIFDKEEIEAFDMAIEALCREQKEEDLAKDIARRMATIIENEQDMRVILKSTEPTDLISRADAEAFVCMERCGEYRKDCPAQTCPIIEHLDSIPSAEQVTSKLKNPCDSLLKDDSEDSKEQKSKLDLISRADALEQMAQAECGLHYEDCEADNCACDYIWRILNIPSADRPSGEWICKDSADMSVYWFECSECGEKTPRDNFNHEYKSNYCPNCGAKMGSEKRVND